MEIPKAFLVSNVTHNVHASKHRKEAPLHRAHRPKRKPAPAGGTTGQPAPRHERFSGVGDDRRDDTELPRHARQPNGELRQPRRVWISVSEYDRRASDRRRLQLLEQ